MHLIQYTIVRPGSSQLLTSCCLSLDPLIFSALFPGGTVIITFRRSWSFFQFKSSLCTHPLNSIYELFIALFCRNWFQCIVDIEVVPYCLCSSHTKLSFTVSRCGFQSKAGTSWGWTSSPCLALARLAVLVNCIFWSADAFRWVD